jgi:hypothetical protein
MPEASSEWSVQGEGFPFDLPRPILPEGSFAQITEVMFAKRATDTLERAAITADSVGHRFLRPPDDLCHVFMSTVAVPYCGRPAGW